MNIEELLKEADIVEYISQYCDFKEQNGELWCLSPFTKEKTPSFSVNPDKQVFYDFSSGTGGNIINFIQIYNRCGVAEAIKVLKQHLNIKDDLENFQRPSVVGIAKKFKHTSFVTKDMIYDPVPQDYMNRFEFNKDKLSSWYNEGISYETMEKFKIKYDPMSNRIVLPVRDYNGNVINISGRTLDEHYKDKGIRKYTYFRSIGTINTLWGWSENIAFIKERNEIILFEGAKSVMKAYEWGVTNTAAILTSHLNDSQMLFLIKQAIPIVFALDSDVNILKDKNIKRLSKYVEVSYTKDTKKLLDLKDSPVDKGVEIWQELYKERKTKA